MGRKTDIQYVDSTVNVTPVCSGCELWTHEEGGDCFAGNLINRYKGNKGWPNEFWKWDETSYYPERIEKANSWVDLRNTDRPGKHWLNGMRRIIFLNDLGDLFSKVVPMEIRLEVIEMMDIVDQHYWMTFTKSAKAMAETYNEYGYVPPNVMPLVSVTSKMNQVRPRIFRDYLMVDPPHRFGISFEPLTSEIEYVGEIIEGADWVTVGGMSRQGKAKDAKEFHGEWAKDIIHACYAHGIPVFMKQLGANFWWKGQREPAANNHGSDWDYFPEPLREREMWR